MSGQLVGEVIAASPELYASGLSKNGFLALIAIAEKCHQRTRQASVPWVHLCHGLYGAHKRTAERAVRELKDAEFIQVARRGYKAPNGDSAAPIYRLMKLPTSVSVTRNQPTPVSVTPDEATDKIDEATDTQGVVLNGSINGSINGREWRARESEPIDVESVPDPGNALSSLVLLSESDIIDGELVDDPPSDLEPPKYCRKHMPNGTDVKCGGCKHMREQHKTWTQRELARFIASAPAVRREPPKHQYRCPWCRDTGIVLDRDGKPGSQPRICHHDHTWHIATPEELAEHTDLIKELAELEIKS
jgi:hypothetical protein